MEIWLNLGKNAPDYDFPPQYTNKFVGAENEESFMSSLNDTLRVGSNETSSLVFWRNNDQFMHRRDENCLTTIFHNFNFHISVTIIASRVDVFVKTNVPNAATLK